MGGGSGMVVGDQCGMLIKQWEARCRLAPTVWHLHGAPVTPFVCCLGEMLDRTPNRPASPSGSSVGLGAVEAESFRSRLHLEFLYVPCFSSGDVICECRVRVSRDVVVVLGLPKVHPPGRGVLATEAHDDDDDDDDFDGTLPVWNVTHDFVCHKLYDVEGMTMEEKDRPTVGDQSDNDRNGAGFSCEAGTREDVHAKSELEQFLAQESAARDISQPLPDILPQSEEEATPLSKLSPLAPEFYPSHPHASNPADTEAIEKSPLGSMEQEIEALSLRETADPFGMQLANPPPKDVVQYPTPDLMQVQTPYTNPFLVPENNDQVPENNEQFPTHITPTEDQHDLKSESQEHFLEKEAQEHDLVRDALQHDLEKDVNEHDLEREDQEHDVKREVQELIPDIYLAPSEEQQPQTEEECCSPIHKYEAGSSDLLFLGDPGKAKEPDNLHSLREVQSEAQFKPCVYREQELHRSPEVENLNNMPETASMNQNAPAVPQELHLHHANDVEDLSQVSPLTPVSESIDITKSDTKVTKESEEVEVLAAPCDSKAMDLEDIQLLGAATADLLESNKMNISISSGSELGPASPQEQISDTNLIPMEITSEVISSPEPPSPKPVVEPEVSKLDIESVAAVATVAAAAVAEASPAPKKSPTQVSPSKAGPKKQAGAKPAEKKPPSPTKTQAKPAATQPTKTDRTAKPAAMKPAPKTTTAPRPAATQKPTEPAKRPASRPTTSTTAPKPKPNPVASTARKVHTGISNSLRPTGAPASTAAPSTAAKPTTTRASTSPGAKARAPLRLAGTRPPATATHTKPSMASTTARPATSNNVAAKPSRPATAGTTATAGATKRPTARTSTMTTARHPTSKPASAVTRARPATATATTTATGATSKPAATKPSTAKEPSKPQASRKPAAPSKVSPIKSPRAATGASKPKAGEAKKISKTPESKSPGKDGTQVSEGAPATDCALVDFGAPDKDDVSVVEGAPTVGAPSLESNPQLVNGDV
ncbi:unnamed protein product [Darwinula stevensoni]|uniref:Uncharacterized protein n=1 Tax=Darwinula stevensoni TaxID=69355 RepID=A0A7R9FNS9_9CRUS|nr:unnamed protein product [Darwinula stevensoni]CAG0896739.1 unnamed protein product [Darwinula stevensoni]